MTVECIHYQYLVQTLPCSDQSIRTVQTVLNAVQVTCSFTLGMNAPSILINSFNHSEKYVLNATCMCIYLCCGELGVKQLQGLREHFDIGAASFKTYCT